MSSPSIRAVLLLAPRWRRSRATVRSVILLGLTFAVLAAVFVCASAFTLSARQQADSDFGSYQQKTYDTVNVGDLAPGFLAGAGAALAAAAPGTHLYIESTELRPDSFVKTYVQAPVATVRFVEDPQLQTAFPGRYKLDQGSWPQAAFDVLVSRHLLAALPDPSKFTVFSGRVTLHIVGVVTDAYAKHDDAIVAGPGTWESIPKPAADRLYQPVEAQVTALFGADPAASDVAGALQKAQPAQPKTQGDRASDLESNYSTRAQTAGIAPVSFGAGQPGVSYLPLLLVVLLVSALVVGQTRSLQRANADRLVTIGIRRSHVLLAQLVALLGMAAAAIAAGLGVGWLVAVALRASVLRHYADQPLSPVPGLDGHMLAIAAASLALILAGTLWPSKSGTPVLGRYLADVQLGLIRRVLVVLLILGAVRVGGNNPVLASYLAVAAVLLLAPDLLRVVVWQLPRSNPRTFVTRRLMRADLGRQAAAVIVVAGCLAIPICVATQLSSTKLSQNALAFNRVPSHQVWVQSAAGAGDLTGVVHAVSAVPGIGQPVVVRGLTTPTGPQGQLGQVALFENLPTGSGHTGTNAMVIESPDELARLLGSALPANAAAVLNAGGVLDFTDARAAQQFGVYSATGKRELLTPTLSTVDVSLNRQFTAQFAGAVLLSTAQKLKLPISEPQKYIYPDVPAAAIGGAAAAAVDAGYDSEFVQYAVPPPPAELPTSAYVFLSALVLGGFAVLLVVIRGQARRLRTYSSRLVAIGLSPRWTLSVLGIQAAVVVGVGLVAGVAAGLLGVRITSARYVELDVPALPIALASGATVLAAALATVLAARALTATEHPQVT